jgi:hypothetical protein
MNVLKAKGLKIGLPGKVLSSLSKNFSPILFHNLHLNHNLQIYKNTHLVNKEVLNRKCRHCAIWMVKPPKLPKNKDVVKEKHSKIYLF